MLPDVYFVFNSDGYIEHVPAHKIVLANRSDVFHKMFYGSLKETGNITIVDSTAEMFKQFLQFIYKSEMELTIENVAEVMYLSQKYNIASCLKMCTDFLANVLDIDNAIYIFSLAMFYDQIPLQNLCEWKIFSDSKEIFQSSSFLECDRQVISHILKMDCLSCFELELFEACMLWLTAASKQETITRDIVREYLGESFYDIGFGVMSIDEFASIQPLFGNLFSDTEYKEIFQQILENKLERNIFKRHRMAYVSWINIGI